MRLLTKAVYSGPDGEFDIDKIVSISFARGTGKSANKLVLRTKDMRTFTPNGELYLDDAASVTVWAKYSKSNDTIDMENDTPLFQGNISAIRLSGDVRRRFIELSVVDVLYKVFNKIWNRPYDASAGFNAPKIIRDIVNHQAEGYIHAELKSDGGFIEDTRLDNSEFPVLDIALGPKPSYEWFRTLSSVENLNSNTEIQNNALVEKKPFIYYIDENNNFHWERPSTTPVMTLDAKQATTFQFVNDSEESFNMVEFSIESDLEGNTIYGYYFDENTDLIESKMVHIPMNFIAKQAPDSVRTDNDTFRDYCIKQATALAAAIIAQSGRKTKSATLSVRGDIGQNFVSGLGSLYTLTHSDVGLKWNLRLHQIAHTINKSGWVATLTFKQDPSDAGSMLAEVVS